MEEDKFSRTRTRAAKTLYAVMQEMKHRSGSMPVKDLYPRLFLLSAGFLFSSCTDDGKMITELKFIVYPALLFFVAYIIYNIANSSKQKKEQEKRNEARRIREAETRAKEQSEREAKQEQYQKDLSSVEASLGHADKTIILEENDINKEIRAYSSLKKVFIDGKTFDFNKVISCSFTDNSSVKKGQTTIHSTGTTKTDTGSAVGRAIVGGAIAGDVGAIIGGATGKKNTTTTSVVNQSADVTIHDYTVWITLQDIANPMLELHIGKDGRKVNEIVALMNAIIASK